MSSRGELFITEDVQDKFRNRLDKLFGRDCWELDTTDWMNMWDEREFPDIAEIDVIDGEETKIGKLKVSVKFSVEGDAMYGRTVEVKSGKLISLEKTE